MPGIPKDYLKKKNKNIHKISQKEILNYGSHQNKYKI